MRTHTLRNKRTERPILTLSPAFLAKAQRCHPEAVGLALHWFERQYTRLTGKQGIHLTHEQVQVFNALAGADASGQWISRFSTLPATAYRLMAIFEAGFRDAHGLSFEQALETAEAFYSMLEKTYLLADADAKTEDTKAEFGVPGAAQST